MKKTDPKNFRLDIPHSGACTHPAAPPTKEQERLVVARHHLVAWRSSHSRRPRSEPNLTSAQLQAAATRYKANPLLSQGLDVQLGSGSYPAGTQLENLPFYPVLVRAFSRTFGPKLFEELMIPDPYPAGQPYWDNFFYKVSPNTNPPLLRVNVIKGGDVCFGETGQYQAPSGPMWLYDCSSEAEVFHEIGHSVMEAGILAGRVPLYFHYAIGGARPVGGSPNTIDSKRILNEYFGNVGPDGKIRPNQGTDSLDGVQVGFVSDYATTDKAEDFAETFRHYVYEPSLLFEKIARQERDFNSSTLSEKAALIASLYQGMYFNDGGIPAGWPGYSI